MRTLPTEEAGRKALSLGWTPGHLICMQGPFSEELNLALLHQLDIRVLVTKESGKAGGFWENGRAAQRAGGRTLVVGRPPQVPWGSVEVLWQKVCKRFMRNSR